MIAPYLPNPTHTRQPLKPISLFIGDKAVTFCACDDCREARSRIMESREQLTNSLDDRDKEDEDN